MFNLYLSTFLQHDIDVLTDSENVKIFKKSDTCYKVAGTGAALPGASIVTDAHPSDQMQLKQ